MCWSSKNKKYIFQSLNHVDIYLKLQFLIKTNYYIVPSPALTIALMSEQVLGWLILVPLMKVTWNWLVIGKAIKFFPIVCHGGQTCKFGFSRNLQFKMYGLIVSNFSVYLIHKYGEEAWDNIRQSIYIRTVRP